jgi:hypothetical protein
MKTLTEMTGPLEVALDARAKGIVAIPCEGKVPLVKWKPWQSEMPPLETQMEWFYDTRVNVAIITTGMVLFDIDDPALVDLVLGHCGPTPHVVHTPRGGTHLGYRARNGVEVGNQVRIKGHPIDIRTNGGIEVIPPSVTELGAYAGLPEGLLPVAELPVAKIGWTRTRVKRRVQTLVEEHCGGDRLLYRGRRYVDSFDRRAVAGHGGHTSLFIAALKIVGLVRRLGGGDGHAWELLLYYNATKCDPPWDATDPREEAQLRHKLEEALRLAR